MLARVSQIVRTGTRFLITMHRQPDGDALGSSLAMACALREMGKDVVHYNPDPAPYNFVFLPGIDAIVSTLDPGHAPFDATLVFDTGTVDRPGPDFPQDPARRGVLVVVDHHETTRPYGDVNYIDTGCAAVGVLVHRILYALHHPVSGDVAQGVYASIISDTGSFRYDSTDAECLAIVGELIDAGVRPWKMASHIYESQPAARVRLLAEVLATLEVHHEGRFASLVVTQEMLNRCGASEDMLDGFVNHARAVDGVEVAALLVERSDGTHKVSFRSRGNYHLEEVGRRLGGKGKSNAASAVLTGDLGDVKERSSLAVASLLGQHDSRVA